MMTAAVGLSPKMVVRSEVTVRGRAEPSLSPRVSRLVAGRSGVAAGAFEELLDAPGYVDTLPLADPDGLETEPLPDAAGALGLGLSVCATAPAARPSVITAMSRRTATLFMMHLL